MRRVFKQWRRYMFAVFNVRLHLELRLLFLHTTVIAHLGFLLQWFKRKEEKEREFRKFSGWLEEVPQLVKPFELNATVQKIKDSRFPDDLRTMLRSKKSTSRYVDVVQFYDHAKRVCLRYVAVMVQIEMHLNWNNSDRTAKSMKINREHARHLWVKKNGIPPFALALHPDEIKSVLTSWREEAKCTLTLDNVLNCAAKEMATVAKQRKDRRRNNRTKTETKTKTTSNTVTMNMTIPVIHFCSSDAKSKAPKATKTTGAGGGGADSADSADSADGAEVADADDPGDAMEEVEVELVDGVELHCVSSRQVGADDACETGE